MQIKIRNRVLRFCWRKFNIAKGIAVHLFGEKHTHGHRIIIGLIMAFFGIKGGEFIANTAIMCFHTIGEFIGVTAHGIGIVPIIDWLGKQSPKDIVGEGEQIINS